jgi:hypothetical protein
METEKKQWTKPKLTVLVRSKREEAVLVACKTFDMESTPARIFSGCITSKLCHDCASLAASGVARSLPLDPLVFGSWESVREGGVYGLCRGLQGV